jgi:hypothetical protein
MPIRYLPFDQITAEHIVGMMQRRVSEDRTLDYKRELVLETDTQRRNFLVDVVAMANASGGVILYGAEEGTGDDEGRIVALHAMPLRVDEMQTRIEHLLRDGIDEHLSGVYHRPIPYDDGHLYVVRIPASPLGPHRVSLRGSGQGYYVRGMTSNHPMDARQVKEAVLRNISTMDRAVEFVRERHALQRSAYQGVIARHDAGRGRPIPRGLLLLHVAPLNTSLDLLDFASDSITDRIRRVVQPFGSRFAGQLRWTFDGLLLTDSESCDQYPWALVDRQGRLEFGDIGFMDAAAHSNAPWIDLNWVEGNVRKALDQARNLAEAGLMSAPYVLSLGLCDVGGSHVRREIYPLAYPGSRPPSQGDMLFPGVIVADWDTDLERQSRGLFDVMWQAWGIPRSPNRTDT